MLRTPPGKLHRGPTLSCSPKTAFFSHSSGGMRPPTPSVLLLDDNSVSAIQSERSERPFQTLRAFIRFSISSPLYRSPCCWWMNFQRVRFFWPASSAAPGACRASDFGTLRGPPVPNFASVFTTLFFFLFQQSWMSSFSFLCLNPLCILNGLNFVKLFPRADSCPPRYSCELPFCRISTLRIMVRIPPMYQ